MLSVGISVMALKILRREQLLKSLNTVWLFERQCGTSAGNAE
jgi:hypothetical protein